MEKLYGLLSGLTAVILGSILFLSEQSPLISSATVLFGIGLTLKFEKKIIKEGSTKTEKKIASMIPVITEILLVVSVVSFTGFLEAGFAYLLATTLKNEALEKLSEISDVNTSRLMGRISRVLLLALGIGASQFNSFILFYCLVGASLMAVYDIAVIVSESASSI